MDTRLKILAVALFAAIVFLGPAPRQALAGQHPENAGKALCHPALNRGEPRGCVVSGPAAYLSRLESQGIRLPLRPLQFPQPPVQLAYTTNAYARVVSDNARVFASLEDAVEGKPVLYRMEPGFEYVTYIDSAEVDGKRYYMVDFGIWMRGADLSRVSGVSSFQGVLLNRNHEHAFGWVLFESESKRTPGFAEKDTTGRWYFRYQMVRIYQVEVVDGQDWYLVGPEEWLEGRLVAGVFPNPVAPEGVEGGRWVEVNLAQQTIAVYEGYQLVFATVIASGVPGQWTRPGLFQAYKKVENETMSGSFTLDRSDYYYLEGVPWTVYFDEARALHGTYWHNAFGVPQSRGCVNLSTGDARWVFDWIQTGDWVYVWDPSGQTPTDPALYSSGGA